MKRLVLLVVALVFALSTTVMQPLTKQLRQSSSRRSSSTADTRNTGRARKG